MSESKRPRRRKSASGDDWESCLELIDGLFAEVDPNFVRSESRALLAAGKEKPKDKDAQRMLCYVRRLTDLESPKEARVLVSLSNISQLWQTQLGLAEFKDHRVKLGMPDISMERLLKLFKGAFNTRNCLEVAKSSSSSSSSGSSGSSSARKGKDKEKDKEKKSRDRDRDRSRERDGDSDTEMDYDEKKEKDRKDSRLGSGAVSLVLTYMLPGDVELQGSFVLQEVSNAQTKTREVANMIFNLLDKKRPQPQPEGPTEEEYQRVVQENKALKNKNETLEAELLRVRADAEAGGLSAATGDGDDAASASLHPSEGSPAAPKKKGKPKRKDRSIINPRMKKRVQRGYHIGTIEEGSASPAADHD